MIAGGSGDAGPDADRHLTEDLRQRIRRRRTTQLAVDIDDEAVAEDRRGELGHVVREHEVTAGEEGTRLGGADPRRGAHSIGW